MLSHAPHLQYLHAYRASASRGRSYLHSVAMHAPPCTQYCRSIRPPPHTSLFLQLCYSSTAPPFPDFLFLLQTLLVRGWVVVVGGVKGCRTGPGIVERGLEGVVDQMEECKSSCHSSCPACYAAPGVGLLLYLLPTVAPLLFTLGLWPWLALKHVYVQVRACSFTYSSA